MTKILFGLLPMLEIPLARQIGSSFFARSDTSTTNPPEFLPKKFLKLSAKNGKSLANKRKKCTTTKKMRPKLLMLLHFLDITIPSAPNPGVPHGRVYNFDPFGADLGGTINQMNFANSNGPEMIPITGMSARSNVWDLATNLLPEALEATVSEEDEDPLDWIPRDAEEILDDEGVELRPEADLELNMSQEEIDRIYGAMERAELPPFYKRMVREGATMYRYFNREDDVSFMRVDGKRSTLGLAKGFSGSMVVRDVHHLLPPMPVITFLPDVPPFVPRRHPDRQFPTRSANLEGIYFMTTELRTGRRATHYQLKTAVHPEEEKEYFEDEEDDEEHDGRAELATRVATEASILDSLVVS
ncbi:hypothetical protein BDY21DRAFT_367274 [Lineolata rhizophorae]|uniref:Uncharacterized protein n=1 Tax=Lineolata rhizophorae TaxID=578093 RepID=A0A6A6NMY9_9PEZI|nr:hypothetical protein BDY21DRAFT_367274 [Lineolata rhizophorae]